jgi:hypothetical protein
MQRGPQPEKLPEQLGSPPRRLVDSLPRPASRERSSGRLWDLLLAPGRRPGAA